jgi:hypothetical protein
MVGDLVNLGRLVVRSRAAVRQCGDPRAVWSHSVFALLPAAEATGGKPMPSAATLSAAPWPSTIYSTWRRSSPTGCFATTASTSNPDRPLGRSVCRPVPGLRCPSRFSAYSDNPQRVAS